MQTVSAKDKKLVISLLILCVIVLAAFFISKKFDRSNNLNRKNAIQAKKQAAKSDNVNSKANPDGSKLSKPGDNVLKDSEAMKKKQKVETSRPAGTPVLQGVPDTSRPRPRPVGL